MLPLDALLGWSRAQFALTACYHWLFVPLTLGLALIMGIMETLYVVKKDEFWKPVAKFWQKLFGINFAIGVATGLILEFEFGTNWSNYSWFVGDIFGAPLAIEGIVAFFLEATFIPLMFFGWKKLTPGWHLAATWLGGLGATISAWWILVANAWMQHPVGMEFNPETVRNEMVSFADVALQGMAVTKFFHTVSSAWMTGAVFVIGVCCWYLLRGRNVQMAKRSLHIAAVVGILSTFIVMATGDRSGIEIAKHQPMKLAAAEGLEEFHRRAVFGLHRHHHVDVAAGRRNVTAAGVGRIDDAVLGIFGVDDRAAEQIGIGLRHVVVQRLADFDDALLLRVGDLPVEGNRLLREGGRHGGADFCVTVQQQGVLLRRLQHAGGSLGRILRRGGEAVEPVFSDPGRYAPGFAAGICRQVALQQDDPPVPVFVTPQHGLKAALKQGGLGS